MCNCTNWLNSLCKTTYQTLELGVHGTSKQERKIDVKLESMSMSWNSMSVSLPTIFMDVAQASEKPPEKGQAWLLPTSTIQSSR